MSRTDVHRPWPVQTADPYNRHLLRCYDIWRGEPQYTSWRNLGCGCPMCTGAEDRKLSRRYERHQAKRLIHRGDWEQLGTRRCEQRWVYAVPNGRKTWSAINVERTAVE